MASHFRFEAIETYLRENIYSSDLMGDWGKKANFRKTCKQWFMEN